MSSLDNIINPSDIHVSVETAKKAVHCIDRMLAFTSSTAGRVSTERATLGFVPHIGAA